MRKQITYPGLITLIILLFSAFPVCAQITITLSDDTIGFGETALVTLSGEVKDISSFAELPYSDAYVVTSRTSNYSFNGKSGNVKLDQTFRLQPLRSGTFEIGPAWVQSGSKRTFSNKLHLTITGGSNASADKTIFMACDPGKRKVYLGEQVLLTIRIYRRTDDEIYSTERPLAKAFNGFFYEQGPYPMDETVGDTIVTVNGIKYIGRAIYREFVFPNKLGKLMLPSYTFTCTVKQNLYPSGDPLIDQLNAVETTVDLESKPVSIEVISLPTKNKPCEFLGDVGRFTLSASIDKPSLHANDPVNLKIEVNGKGNISMVQLKEIHLPKEFHVFPSTADVKSEVTSNGMKGYKTFTIKFIPEKPGDYKIPPAVFSFYDAAAGEYKTLRTDTFTIHVDNAVATAGDVNSNLPDAFPEEVSPYKDAIRYILYLVGGGALIFLFVFIRNRRKKKEIAEAPQEVAREIELPKGPSPWTPFRTAEEYFSYGNTARCISELYNAVRTAFSVRCELGDEELSPSHIRYRLTTKKLDESLIEESLLLYDELTALRYQKGVIATNKLTTYMSRTAGILSKLGF